MPTARPIIIEKFIDHTDSGVPAVSRCSAAQPTKMPATASSRGSPAATAEPKATNSKMTVGSPERSSARWRACSFSALKSLHTAHSPVTLAVAPAGKSTALTWSISWPADLGSSASVVAANWTGTSAVRPSGEIRPASGGSDSGSTTEAAPGAPCKDARRVRRPAGCSAIGASWW